LELRQRIAASAGKPVGEVALLSAEGEMLRDSSKVGDIKGCPPISVTVVIRRQWAEQLEQCICRNLPEATGGLATAHDGIVYAVSSNSTMDVLQMPPHVENVTQDDGSSARKEVDEAFCLQTAMATGQKPPVGMWIGKKKYTIIEREEDTPSAYGSLKTLVCVELTRDKSYSEKAVFVAVSTGSNIVVGQIDLNSMSLGNLRQAVTSFAEFLASQGM